MRRLIVSTFLTLDGVMQAPGGPGEDDSGGFAHGGWSVNYWDDQMGQVMGEATSRPFAMVLGRRTFDIMAAYWPHASEEEGGKVFNEATKYVASRSRPNLEAWSNSVLIEGDAAEGLAALKAEDGPELQVHGSANLIQTLLRHNLVDRVDQLSHAVGRVEPARRGEIAVAAGVAQNPDGGSQAGTGQQSDGPGDPEPRWKPTQIAGGGDAGVQCQAHALGRLEGGNRGIVEEPRDELGGGLDTEMHVAVDEAG